MTFEKTVLHELAMPYAIGVLGAGPSPSVAFGTEDRGPAFRIDPPYREARPLAPGPGGCMALVADPGRSSDVYAIMGCFLGYRFQGAGIDRLRPGAEPVRVADLPFAHRIAFARRGARRVLIAASLAADKTDASDWSRPGAVYAAELDGEAGPALRLEPVLTGIHRNHGLLLAELEGRPSLLVSGSEGVMSVDLQAPGAGWPWRLVLPRETSELALFDLDGDGRPELVTIEPFHGNTLRAYRGTAAGWEAFWEAELQYGHCVLAGTFQGRRSVLVSNRAGGRELLLFQFGGDREEKPRRLVVDAGAGAANLAVIAHGGKDRIVATNQVAGQLAMYTPGE